MNKIKTIPDDPTVHADDFLADPTGLTGVTVSNSDPKHPKNPEEKINEMSSVAYDQSIDTAEGNDGSGEVLSPLSDTDGQIDIDGAGVNSPGSIGEYSESGSAPDPESDDDVTQSAQNMGIGLNADPEHPQELNIAADMDAAEEYKRTH